MREGEGLGWPEDQTASGWDIRDVTNITKEAKWGSYLEARVAQVNRRYMGVCLTSVEPAWLTSFPHCIQSTGQVMSHLRKLHWGVADLGCSALGESCDQQRVVCWPHEWLLRML